MCWIEYSSTFSHENEEFSFHRGDLSDASRSESKAVEDFDGAGVRDRNKGCEERFIAIEIPEVIQFSLEKLEECLCVGSLGYQRLLCCQCVGNFPYYHEELTCVVGREVTSDLHRIVWGLCRCIWKQIILRDVRNYCTPVGCIVGAR